MWYAALLLGAVALAAAVLVACDTAEDRSAQQTADAAALSAQQTIAAALSIVPTIATQPSTPTPPPTPTPNATATQRALEEMVASMVAATATEQARAIARERATTTALAATQVAQIAATATEQARLLARERATAAALAALQAAQIAAAATEQARIAALVATQSAQTAEAVLATLVAQSNPTPDLLGQLRSRLMQARVVNRYPERADRLLIAVVSRLDEFVAPGYGVWREEMTAALLAPGAEDRLNGLVDNVWFEWEKDAGEQGWNAYDVDPNLSKISPLRKLIIRLIQGTQGAISEQQAYAFYNFLTRYEEDHVWFDYVQGVIGAVNREIFNWP